MRQGIQKKRAGFKAVSTFRSSLTVISSNYNNQVQQ
jgi:hypothetical protein